MGRAEQATNGATRIARDATKAEQLKQRRNNRGSGDIADWGGSESQLLANAIAAVTKHGYAILLGYTRDKGAYTCTIVGLEGHGTEYIRPSEDIDLFLTALALDFDI